MRIGRAIIIPAIVAFGVAGSTIAGSATALASVHPKVHSNGVYIQPMGNAILPLIYYHS